MTHPVGQQPLARAQFAHALVARQSGEHDGQLFLNRTARQPRACTPTRGLVASRQIQGVELVLRQLRRRAPVDAAPAAPKQRGVRAVRPAQRRPWRPFLRSDARRSAQRQRQQTPRVDTCARSAAPPHRPVICATCVEERLSLEQRTGQLSVRATTRLLPTPYRALHEVQPMSAPARAGKGVAAVEVVPNGRALAVVRSWLPAPADGDEDYDAMLDWGDHPVQDEPQRPARRAARRPPERAAVLLTRALHAGSAWAPSSCRMRVRLR